MKTKHYFHELPEQEKKFHFSTALYATDPKVKFFIATVLVIVTIADLILRLLIFPVLVHGQPYPIYTPAIIPLMLCLLSILLGLASYPRISEKNLNRMRRCLACVTVMAGATYHYLVNYDFITRTLETKSQDDWTLALITMSNSVHFTAFSIMIGPTWFHPTFGLVSVYAAVITAYMQSDESLKDWVIVKSLANIFYLAGYILIGSYIRWRAFLKSSEAEAWNQVYNDTLNRIPSSIAVMNVSGDLIYSNAEFKKNAEDDPQKLFSSITNLKLRELSLFSTSESLLPKNSNEDFGLPSPTSRHPGPLSGRGSPYFMLKTKEITTANSSHFNRLEDLLEYYRALLANNELKNDEPAVYDSKMERRTLYHHHIYSYEVIIRPLVEYKKIVIILNNTTQRDLVASFEDNNDYKDKLLASISHELRTPLNGNLVLLQAAVQEEDVPETVKERLLIPALRSGRLLSHLINDILDYSTILADKITLSCEKKSIRESLEYCYQLFEHVFKAKQLKFDLTVGPLVPSLFHTDHQRLIQVILNLLSNALKFTFNGGVTIEARIIGNDASTVEILVSDTGIGISKEILSSLFEEDLILTARGAAANCKGVGLGLKVTSKLVRMLGPEDGEGLKVSSVDREGSVFSFKIVEQGTEVERDEEKIMNEFEISGCSLPDVPAELIEDNKHINVGKFKSSKFKHVEIKTAAKVDTRRIEEISSSCRISKALIVDDDQINIMALETLLKQYRIEAESAYNGQQGIDKVLAHPDKYQIIFMDCQMPVMDGFEATRKLVKKMKSKEIPTITIVGCTTFSAKKKIEECIKSGMAEVINKPVFKEKLKQIIDKYA